MTTNGRKMNLGQFYKHPPFHAVYPFLHSIINRRLARSKRAVSFIKICTTETNK